MTRILLADDHTIVRQGLKLILASQSDLSVVGEAANGREVVELAQKLKPDGIFVGQAMVLGTVKGTGWDNGSATVEAATVAAKLWELSRARNETTVKIG